VAGAAVDVWTEEPARVTAGQAAWSSTRRWWSPRTSAPIRRRRR
jgi:hypothetical protein